MASRQPKDIFGAEPNLPASGLVLILCPSLPDGLRGELEARSIHAAAASSLDQARDIAERCAEALVVMAEFSRPLRDALRGRRVWFADVWGKAAAAAERLALVAAWIVKTRPEPGGCVTVDAKTPMDSYRNLYGMESDGKGGWR